VADLRYSCRHRHRPPGCRRCPRHIGRGPYSKLTVPTELVVMSLASMLALGDEEGDVDEAQRLVHHLNFNTVQFNLQKLKEELITS
jgi:hypothetical protein